MLQPLLNGVVQGSLFAVVAVAFSLVYATTGVFHLALGAIYTLAPYVLLTALEAGQPWFAGIAAAVAAAATLGLAAEEILHRPLERRRAPAAVHLIASLGAFLVLGQVVVLIWGSDARVLRAGIDSVHNLAGLTVTGGQAVGAVTAGVALAATFAWLRWTDIGLQFRALASNPRLLATLGRDIRKLRRIVFAGSGALAAVAALAAARDVGFDTNVGMRTVLVGIAATIVGGRGSVAGAAVAGVVLGIVRAQVVWHGAARWEEAATFVVLAAFLLLVPEGLSGFVRSRASRVDGAT